MFSPILIAILAQSEWHSYGGTAEGARFSTLNEIHKGNVTRLKPVWTIHHGDMRDPKKFKRPSAFQATPIVVDGVLYFPTPFNRLYAVDPATGKVTD